MFDFPMSRLSRFAKNGMPITSLMIEKDSATSSFDTTPGSFGERARGRSERNGSCILRGCA